MRTQPHISPLFTSTRSASTTTTTTTNRNSLLTLITSLQNISLEIHATSHFFTTTVPLSSALLILPTYLSGVINALETLPQKGGVLRKDMRIKVVIVHGLRESFQTGAEVGDGYNTGGEVEEGFMEEAEYLFFGTKEGIIERFPIYLDAVLRIKEDRWAVERVNEVLLKKELAEKDAARVVERSGVGMRWERVENGGFF